VITILIIAAITILWLSIALIRSNRQNIIKMGNQAYQEYAHFYQGTMIYGQIDHLHQEVNELQEAIENSRFATTDEIREYQKTNSYWQTIKHSIEDEVADVLIIALSFAAHYKIDIAWHVRQKMKYNRKRNYHLARQEKEGS